MELADQLDDFLDNQVDAEQQGFAITDNDKADWALRKIEQYQAKIDDANKLRFQRTQQINAWCAGIEEENQKQINYLESLLIPYAECQLKNSKKHSFTLPSGTIGFRKTGNSFNIDGDTINNKSEKLITIVEKINPEFIKTEKMVNWIDFKKTLKVHEGKVVSADGEFIDDIKVEIGKDSFYAKGGSK